MGRLVRPGRRRRRGEHTDGGDGDEEPCSQRGRSATIEPSTTKETSEARRPGGWGYRLHDGITRSQDSQIVRQRSLRTFHSVDFSQFLEGCIADHGESSSEPRTGPDRLPYACQEPPTVTSFAVG